ncbi:MAG: PEGA domain-containing protein [Alphaproteobacteria bacterium]|nr:PEGA domain-containing protein [Alphaproteobacteria bacterium]
MSRRLVPALLMLLTLSGPALAGSAADEAEVNFRLAAKAYQGGDYERALFHFMVSDRLSPNRNVTFNIGRTYEALEMFPEAYRWYQAALQLESGKEDEKVVGQIRDSIERLGPRVALFSVTSDPPGAEIYVDRKDLGAVGVTPADIALKPGTYKILLEKQGYEGTSTESYDLPKAGLKQEVSLKLKAIVGTVKVSGEEGSTVHLGTESSEPACQVPCAIDLPEGKQILYFKKPGFRSLPSLLDIVRDAEIEVRAELLPITGTVIVDADERGALIEVDGKAVGYTPAVLSDVQIGKHVVKVSRSGFETYEAEVEVVEGEQLDLGRIRLDPSFRVTAASRTAQDVSEAPASVTLIPAEEIRAFGYQTVYEAAGGVRGVFQTFDLTYHSLGFRGFGRVGDYGNRVLTTIDGHTTNDDQIGSSYVGTDFLADLGDVKQIEIVRGPGSSLYGSNAVFGVVNLVMRDGTTTNRPHVSATATDGLVRGRASAGVGDEDNGAWLTVSGLYGLGREYEFEEYANDPRTGGVSKGADKTTATTVSGKAWFGDFTIKGNYNGREKQIPSGSFGMLLADPRSRSNDFRGFLEAEYDHAFGNTRVDVRASFDAYRFRGVFPYGRTYNYVDFYDGAWVGVEPRVIQTIGEVADVTVGAETQQHFLARMVSEERETPGGDPIGTPLDERPTFQTYSAYAVADVHPGDLVRLNVGGRFDAFLYDDAAIGTFSSFNPRAALILTPGDEVFKVFGGTAFRAPSMYEFFYNDGGISTVRPESLSPETVLTVEGEWTHQFDEVLSLTAAGYFNQIQNLVDSEDLGDVFRFANVDDTVRTVGGEAEVRRSWRSGWMIAGQASFQRTRIGSLSDGAEFTNSPVLLASAMGAIPLGNSVTLAQKVRGESPRLTNAGDLTPWACIWDVTLTGRIAEPNIQYGLGVRNLLDWRLEHPGGPDVRQDVFVQRGRDLFATVTLGF